MKEYLAVPVIGMFWKHSEIILRVPVEKRGHCNDKAETGIL